MKKQMTVLMAVAIFMVIGCAAKQPANKGLGYTEAPNTTPVAISTQVMAENTPEIQIFFSPYDDCIKPWTETIAKCSSYVYVSCFGITNKEITDELCKKAKAGIHVIVCTDKMQAGNKTAKLREAELRAAGAEYVIKKIQVLEHNKMMFGKSIDGNQYAITGSYNISGNAQSQDNNLQLFHDTNITNKVKAAIERIYNRDKIK